MAENRWKSKNADFRLGDERINGISNLVPETRRDTINEKSFSRDTNGSSHIFDRVINLIRLSSRSLDLFDIVFIKFSEGMSLE